MIKKRYDGDKHFREFIIFTMTLVDGFTLILDLILVIDIIAVVIVIVTLLLLPLLSIEIYV